MRHNQVILNCLAIAAAQEKQKRRDEQRHAFATVLSPSQLDMLLFFNRDVRDCGEITSMFCAETD